MNRFDFTPRTVIRAFAVNRVKSGVKYNPCRLNLVLLSAVAVCALLLVPARAFPEDAWRKWNWGAAGSAKALYRPAHKIEFREKAIGFLGDKVAYVYHREEGNWTVLNFADKVDPSSILAEIGGEIRPRESHVVGSTRLLAAGPGTLDVSWSACSQPLDTLQLWTREQVGRVWFEHAKDRWGLTPSSLEEIAARIKVAEPYVGTRYHDGTSVWLPITFYAGEGYAGVGTIVQITQPSCQVRIHQPPEVAPYSIGPIVGAKGYLWLTTGQIGEGTVGPGIGLVRYDPNTSTAEPIEKNGLTASSDISALELEGETLWIAASEGIHALDVDTQSVESWRIIPEVVLNEPTPVLNLPGGEPRGSLLPGRYEVRWVGESFLEIVTSDCVEGFVEGSWYRTLLARKFNINPLRLISSSTRPAALSLFPSPVENPVRKRPHAWFLRVPAVARGKEKEGWQPVRVCAGWIQRSPKGIHLVVENTQSPRESKAARIRAR